MELNNDIKKTVPVCYDCPLVASCKDFPVTFKPGNYYRIELYANILGKASGYSTGSGYRTDRYGTKYSLASHAKLNELYLKLQ